MTTSKFEQRKKQLIEQLQSLNAEMLRGSLIKRYRRCGKPNCHCAQEQGHESYYLSVSMPGRNPIMIYVSFKNQDRVKKALANYQMAQSILEDISTLNREALTRKEIL